MKKVSKAYKQAMNKRLRDRSYMIVTVGIISNEAQANAYVSSDSHYLSNNKGIFKDSEVKNTYATFEQNVFKADGSMIFPPENTGYQQLASDVGFMSAEVKGSITIGFDKPYDIKGLTINFGEYYPRSFTITTSSGVSHSYSNSKALWTTDDNFDGTSWLTITPSTFVNGNNKRLRIESILMGIGIVFQNEDIESASFTDSVSFISEELPQIDFSITCFDRDKRFRVDDSNSFINYLESGQEISTSMGIELEDGTVEWVNLPLTYLSSWSSNNDKVAFTAVDRFAFMTGKYTAGNTIHSRTLYSDAIAVLTDAGLEVDEYEVADFLRTITVRNPLPEVSHAECLQLIANAGRCVLKQNDVGKIILEPNFENILEPNDLDVITDSQAYWSIPSNIKRGADTVYADFTENFFSADGSMKFLPTSASQANGSGYVSKQIASADGGFFENLIEYPYGASNRTVSGLTFTDNRDGSITVQGTATANTWFAFRANSSSDPHYMTGNTAPWQLGDILQIDYFVRGAVQGTIGITWQYKDSSGNIQGEIFRSTNNFNLTDGNVKYSVCGKQTINPRDMSDKYVAGYLYISNNCVIDATFEPVLTKRQTLGNLILYPWGSINSADNSYTSNGITYTLLGDGGILVNGTATSESTFNLVTPYISSYRQSFEEGHTYKLSEGRKEGEVTSYHTNPYLQWVRYDSELSKYNYDFNTTRGDKTYTFTNADSNLGTYGVRIVVPNGKTVDNVELYPSLIDVDDYDESETSPTHYVSGEKPSLSMVLPAPYTFHGFQMLFAGYPPQEFTVNTYRGNTLIDTLVVDEVHQECNVQYSFYNFDKMKFDFTKGAPNSRVVVQKISFGNLSEYELKKEDMIENPIGTVEPKTQSVDVRVFTFQNGQSGEQPQALDDNVYATFTVNPTGNTVTFENQLISTQAHALDVAEWIANYYANNITYEVNYRGEPRIESADYIFLESEVLDNLQVEVESHTINFNGGLSGSLNLRRASNMVNS